MVYLDASDSDFDGCTVEHGGKVAHGQWDTMEVQQSSTWHELRAVRLVLESLMNKLRNCTVKWFTDNQNVARIIQVGSKNELADFISHIQDWDHWQLHPTVFSSLQIKWA